ncbi:hypothetical protein TNCV_4062501 [Trichonephila clavipes]|nr:hypothetical protein TNCV_4062501 [Trichonephila clavipes]
MGPSKIVADWTKEVALGKIGFGLCNDDGPHGIGLKIYLYTLQESLFICYKQSFYDTRSFAFARHANSARLFEDETVNHNGIIDNLIVHEDGQKEPDSMTADEIYANVELSPKSQKAFS